MYLELAQTYLQKARTASGATRQYFANLCQVCLAKQGISPASIGTTSQELLSLQSNPKKVQNEKIESLKAQVNRAPQDTKQHEVCKKQLEQARVAKGASRQYYAYVCQTSLEKFGISPADISTTMEELQSLQKKGLLESAKSYLSDARNAAGTKQKCYADLCWEYLRKAKAKPEEIGSTTEELTVFSK